MEISEAVRDFVNTIAAHVAYRAKG